MTLARVALLCPDLLFGSRVEGALRAAGHEVARYDADGVAEADALVVDLTGDGVDVAAVARAAVPESDVLVVDLTADDFDAATLVESMRMGRELEGVPAVGFYPHVDVETRRRALEAGYDVVVPR